MSVTEAKARGEVGALNPEHLAGDNVRKWSAMCGDFLAWEREHMLKSDPSPKQQEDHRQCLKWLLRLTRQIYSMAADPEFPDRSAFQELSGRLLQLEESWKQFYEAMAAEQADRFLARIFPDER
jgi:hypothetical protein